MARRQIIWTGHTTSLTARAIGASFGSEIAVCANGDARGRFKQINDPSKASFRIDRGMAIIREVAHR